MPQDTPVINPNNPALTGINPNDLLTAVQKQLLGSSGAISSTSSKIEDAISGAIAKTTEANTASKAATESTFNREIGVATEKAVNAETSFNEATRGYATNTAALKDLRTTNEKSIRDLEQRKQEALMSADSATASKISDLILQKYTFEQQAQQQVFSNLISLSNFGLQLAQEKRLGQTQTFNEDQAKSSIALKYGIEVKPGDTFQDVVNRAKPFASAEQKMQLDQAAANLELTRANTKQALANAEKALKDNKASTLTSQDFDVYVKAAIASDPKATADSIKAKIQGIAGLSAEQRTAGYAAVDAYFKQQESTTSVNTPGSQPFGSPLANTLYNTGTGLGAVGQTVLDFIFGTKNEASYPSLFR